MTMKMMIPLAILKLSKDLFGCTFRELEQIDSELNTCGVNVQDWTPSANILVKDVHETVDNAEEDDAEQINLHIQTISIPMTNPHLR